jgi:hypothetical protein
MRPFGWAVFLFVGAGALAACGARSGPFGESDAEPADADVPDTVMTPDTAPPVDAFRPPVCVGRDDVGGFVGAVPGIAIDFPFVVGGVEPDGTHSCPRFFIRAGDAADFSGATLEIEVPLDDASRTPGEYPGTMTVLGITGEIWTEEIFVEVLRADGLFDLSLPVDEWRGSARVSHHDATTDLEGDLADAPYCTNFAICI